MKNELNDYKGLKQLNVYDNYKNIVVPKIKLLDIFLKTDYIEFNDVGTIINNNNNNIYTLTALNQLLDIFELEKSYMEEIICFLDKTYIDKDLIFYLILNTNSYISGIIKREMICGSPILYSPNDISYIYDLDFNKVSKAFKFLNYTYISSEEIELILFQIS